MGSPGVRSGGARGGPVEIRFRAGARGTSGPPPPPPPPPAPPRPPPPAALAVDGQGFELDGDLRKTGGGVDWADLFDVVGSDVPEPKASLPDGFGTATFVRDFKPGASGPGGTPVTQ